MLLGALRNTQRVYFAAGKKKENLFCVLVSL